MRRAERVAQRDGEKAEIGRAGVGERARRARERKGR